MSGLSRHVFHVSCQTWIRQRLMRRVGRSRFTGHSPADFSAPDPLGGHAFNAAGALAPLGTAALVFTLPAAVRIYIAADPVDLRR